MAINYDHHYTAKDMEDWSPEDRESYIDHKLGIEGGRLQHEEIDEEDNWDNWSNGAFYNPRSANAIASENPYLSEKHIEHIKRHGDSSVKLGLFYNEHIPPKHHAEMWEKWADDDSHHGYELDDFTRHLYNEHSDRMYDGDFDHIRDEAYESVTDNYTMSDFIHDSNIQDYDDAHVAEYLDGLDWVHDNPDFDESVEEDPDENPRKIDFSDHHSYDKTDHPEWDEREDKATDHARHRWTENGYPDHVYESYDEAIQDDVHEEFRNKLEDHIKESGYKDYDLLPDHVRGHIPYLENMEEIKRQKKLEEEARKEKELSDWHDKVIPHREKVHEYGPGQHHLEMMKDFADANKGAIDIGKMTKVYPGLKEEWKKHFADKGKLTSEEIQQKIEAIPKTKFHVSYGKWGANHAQNTNNQDQVVVRLDHTPESYDKIKSKSAEHAELFDKLQNLSRMSGHPSNADTIGWARMDLNDPKHAFLDEMQTDFSSAARTQLEQAGHTDKAKVIQDIADDHKIWREALMNYVIKMSKKNGFERLSTHSAESKAKHTGASKVHSVYKEAYKQQPRAMGFRTSPKDELPLTPEGKKNFVSEEANAAHHVGGFEHHMRMAQALRSSAFNAGFGVPSNNPKRVSLAEHHEKLASDHSNRFKSLNGDALSDSDFPKFEPFNHSKFAEKAKEAFDAGKPYAHPHDKLLKPSEDFTGHTLDLTPKFALQKAEDWEWDFDIEDLIKIDVIDEGEALYKSLSQEDKEETDYAHGLIELYKKNKDAAMPTNSVKLALQAKHIDPDKMHDLLDLIDTPINKHLTEESSIGTALRYHPSLTSEHMDKYLKHDNWAKDVAATMAVENSPKFSELEGSVKISDKIGNHHIPMLFDRLLNSSFSPYAGDFIRKYKKSLSKENVNSIVDKAMKDKNWSQSTLSDLDAIRSHSEFSNEHAKKLADSSLYTSFALRSPQLSPDDLSHYIEKMSGEWGEENKFKGIGDAIGENPNLTPEHINKLIHPLINKKKDPNTYANLNQAQEEAAVAAAAHPAVTDTMLHTILSGDHSSLAYRAIKNPKTTKAHLDTAVMNWAGDGDATSLLEAVIKHPEVHPDHFDQIKLGAGLDSDKLPYGFYSNPKLPKKHLDSLFNGDKSALYRDLIQGMHNPNVEEHHVMGLTSSKNEILADYAKTRAKNLGFYEDPDKVNVSFGTTKHREVRDLAFKAKDRKIHKKELEKVGLNPQALGIQHLQDAQGHIPHDAIDKHINEQPTSTYGYSHSEYGEDNSDRETEALEYHMGKFHTGDYGIERKQFYKPSAYNEKGELQVPNDVFDMIGFDDEHFDQEGYEAATEQARQKHKEAFKTSPQYGNLFESTLRNQQHNLEASKVFQLNITKDHFKKMKEHGVLDTFKDMMEQSYNSGHPASSGNGIGWVRYTTKPDGVFVDEIQSDFGQSFAKQAAAQLKNKVRLGQMSQDEADRHTETFNQRFPEDHFKKISNIIFNDKHPNEVLHEGFKQYLRDSGQHGKQLHMWDTKSKAPLSGMNKEEAPPVHMKVTYNQNPKKMGYKPAKYGEIQTQNNPKLIGEPTWAHTLKKARLVLNTLNKTLGNKK